MLAEVEDAGGQDGIGTTLRDAFDEMLERADASRGDDRHVDSFRDRRGERQVEAVLGAVTIHRREQDLPGTETHDFLAPYDGIDASAGPSSMREDLKARRSRRCCVRRSQRHSTEPRTPG